MRKALVGLILAATAMSPVAAGAQDWHGRGDRGGHSRNQNEGDGGEGHAARAERHQQREAQPAPQPQPEQQQQVQVAERQRHGDGNRGNDGNRGDNGRRGNDGNRGDNGNRGNWRGGNTQPSIYPQAWQGDPNDPRLRRYQETERRNQQRYGDDNRRGDDRRNWRNDRSDRNGWQDNRGGRNWRNDWNRNWRNDNRYDWQRWRYTNRNRFHIGNYYSPYGNYGYNRFSIGLFLEPLFFGRNYWIGDPWQYRLPPAPPGTQWIRYYDDVLLVDIYSGEVIDAIYDFFW